MASTVSGANLDDIYDRLNTSPTSHPFDATTVSADWSIEAGDIVKVKRDGEEYDSPLHSNSLTWKGAAEMNLSSGGNESRDSISKQSKNKYSSSNSIYSEQRIYKEFTSSDGMLHSSLLMTASVLRTEFDNELSDVHSSIEQTAEYIITEVHASNSQLYSYVDQTATYIQSVVADVEHDLGSAILQTASQIRSEVHASSSELYSYVDQTATYIQSVVADVENDLGSAILQTASEIRSEVHASSSELYSYVDQTATYIQSVVADVENDLGSAILQTASQIRSEVHASNSELYSYVDQTATYINQEVADTAAGLSSRITQQSNRIGLVVEGTGADAKVNVAQIVASINEDGTSDALIKADKILLDGNTTVSGMMRVQDGNLFVSGGLTLAEGNEISASQYRVGGSIRFPGAQHSSQDIYLTKSDIENMIVSASVDRETNTLTLVPKTGDPITFNKAASGGTKVSGSWSGATLTVATSETGLDAFATTISTGLVTDTTVPNNPTYHITAYKQDNGQQRPTELQSARIQYKLGTLAATPTIVRILDSSGTRYINGTAMYTIPLTTLNATSNGTYSPSGSNVGYSSVTVDVPSGTANVKTRFSGSSGQYYVEAFDSVSGTSISGSSITYKLARSGLNVQIQDTEGSQISGTASYTIPLQSKRVTENGTYSADSGFAGLSSVNVSVNPTIGSTFVKDGSTYYVSATKDGNEVSSARKQIALARNGTSVEIQDGHGTARPDTPTYTIPLRTLNATANGDYTPSSNYVGYSSVTVNVPSGTENIRTRFSGSSGQYYVEAFDNVSGTSISGSSITYKLARSGLNVQIQDTNDTQISGTASYTIPLQSKSITSYGTYTVTPDSGYIGFSSVNVNVPDRYENGWTGAYNKVTLPSAGTSASMVVKTPNSASSANPNPISTTYTVSADNSYAYIKQGSTVVARATHSAYANGWTGAYNKVTLPSANTSSASMVVKTPNSSSSASPNPVSTTYTLSSDNNVAYIKTGTTIVAQLTHNKYTTGYNAGVSDGKTAAGVSGSWGTGSGANTLTVKRELSSSTKSITYTVTASAPTATYNSSTHKYSLTGKALVNNTQKATGTGTTGTEAYDAGVTAGKDAAGISASWGTGSGANTLTVSRALSSTTKSATYTVTAGAPTGSYNSSTHKYALTGTALVNGSQKATGSGVTGTEAFDAGYESGWRDGWNAYYYDKPDWVEDWTATGTTTPKYACVPKRCSSATETGFDFYNSPYGRGKGNFSNNTSETWFSYSAGGTSHSPVVYSGPQGPFSTLNDLRANMGYSTVYQCPVTSISSNGYYAIEIRCGSTYRCYYFRKT